MAVFEESRSILEISGIKVFTAVNAQSLPIKEVVHISFLSDGKMKPFQQGRNHDRQFKQSYETDLKIHKLEITIRKLRASDLL